MNHKVKYLTNEFTSNLKEYMWFIFFILLYMLYFIIFHEGNNCVVKLTVGIPCPGCGMTRAIMSLIQFKFVEAFMFHPLVYVLPVIFVVLFFKNVQYINVLFKSKVFWGIIVGLFITVYVVRMILHYPDTVPMDHYHESLLDLILH